MRKLYPIVRLFLLLLALTSSGNLLAQRIFALSSTSLLSFDASTPQTVSTTAITGLLSGQTLVGLDFRPATGELYAFGFDGTSVGQLYVLNKTTAVATPRGAAINGLDLVGEIAFDFNPTVDRIRLEAQGNKNYRLHPVTGAIAAFDGDLKYNTAGNDPNVAANPAIGSAAYTNSFIGSTATTLYAFDDSLKTLTIQSPPNDGVLNTIGELNLSAIIGQANSDLDIYTDPTTLVNKAYFLGSLGTSSSLYELDLVNANVTLIALIPSAAVVTDIAVEIDRETVPVPAGDLAYGITSTNNLISFYTANPSFLLSATPITAIPTGMNLVGSDFRPATGQYYALAYNAATSLARVVVIDRLTAAITTVYDTVRLDLSGKVTFDFNPTVDRIRVQTSNGKNYRLNPNNGALAANDGDLKYAAGDVNFGTSPNAVAGAYTNSYIGSSATSLYVYDGSLNSLALQSPPNDGVLNTIGASGITANTTLVYADMDIYYNPTALVQTAYLSANSSTSAFNDLYTIDLATGTLSAVGSIGLGVSVKDISVFIDRTAPVASGYLAYGITSNNNLIAFNTGNPEFILSSKALTGIPSGRVIVGSDFRPATGEYFAMTYTAATNTSQLITIDVVTGAVVKTLDPVNSTDLSGKVTFDFNPTVDRIRVQTSNGKNYRYNPNNGAVAAVDGNLKYADADANFGTTANAVAGAYTNSVIGATSTKLYVYDGSLNILALQNPPNDGTLNTIGASGVTVNTTTVNTDMDIFTDPTDFTQKAFISANTTSGFNQLYSVDLATGALTLAGTIGNGVGLRDFAIFIDKQVPVATGDLAYGITSTNNLISFYTGNPSNLISAKPITNIPAGMALVGSDFRPATGEYFALGFNASTGIAAVLIIDRNTAAVTKQFDTLVGLDLSGKVTFDFNPTVDRIRVQTSTGKNYRLNPNNGTLAATDGTLKFAAADVNAGVTPFAIAGAYTNSYIATTTTGLYVFDGKLNTLSLQNPPNDGVLNTIGGTGLLADSVLVNSDMDIYFNPTTRTNAAYLSSNASGKANFLYGLNITTGATTNLGSIGLGLAVRDIAVFIDRTAPVDSSNLIYAVSGNNNLISFKSANPQFILSAVPLSGVAAGYTMSGFDFRPATGELFALAYNGVASRMYTVNLNSGALTAVGDSVIVDLTGQITFDFNPTVDRIRVQTSNGKNFRFNPNNGAIAATDGSLKFAASDVNAAASASASTGAYTNSTANSTNTSLYVYDGLLNVLALQSPPNDGVLNTIGSTGIVANAAMTTLGMDILYNASTQSNSAYLNANIGSATNDNFYTLNLSTGEATLVGSIGLGIPVRDIAAFIPVANNPAPDGLLVYGVTNSNQLISFNSGNPEVIRSSAAITGVSAGYILAATDFRPLDGKLYGVAYNATTSSAKLYTISLTTGAAAQVGDSVANLLLVGRIDMDFNPTVDRIRLIARGNNVNYRMNPNDGKIVATDGVLKYKDGDINFGVKANVGAVAYTNSFFGTTTTTLYDIDDSLNILLSQVPPNDGILNTIGATGIVVNATDRSIAMDIFYNKDSNTNEAYVSANTNSLFDRLYSINLTTGLTTLLGSIGGATAVKDISVPLDPRSVTVGEIASNSIPVSLYPNPISSETVIEFELKGNTNTSIEVLDLTGKVLQKITPSRSFQGLNQVKWNTEALAKGIYIVRIQSGTEQAVLRATKL